jgi:hypothetical protein
MELFYRSEAPRYKGTAVASTQTSTSLLAGLWRGVLGGGGGQPTYRQADGVTAPAFAPPRCCCKWWQESQRARQYMGTPDGEPGAGEITAADGCSTPACIPLPNCDEVELSDEVPSAICIW